MFRRIGMERFTKRQIAIFAAFAAAMAVLLLCLWRLGGGAERVVIYSAHHVLTMDEKKRVEAVAVRGGLIVATGALEALRAAYPDAELDLTFQDLVIAPGFIDPHVHMLLSAVQYALPTTPPWPMVTGAGEIAALSDRDAFLERLEEIAREANGRQPLIVYGYHDLVHGAIDRHDLDAITDERPLIVWHYSSHDFYLNSAALDWAKIDASLHEQFEGVAIGSDGEPTGRVFEDAIPYLNEKLGPVLLNPLRVRGGFNSFSDLLRRGGVTTVADLGYGIFGLTLEDINLRLNWRSPQHSGYRVYMVPEHRGFERAFGDKRVETILKMAEGTRRTPAPVLPQVKFFVDAAFYSQTMRLSPPGYLSGQSKGSEGLWVTQPSDIASTIEPYWRAGLGVRIHSNGDRAQTATLQALESLRADQSRNRFVIEHAGLMSPEHVRRSAELGASVSAASHYVHYLGRLYQDPLGPERGGWIEPLRSLSAAGVRVTLHSDAPLAPPLPLLAASVHMTRSTREGSVLTPNEKLSADEALEAITIDAAHALGLEDEIGSIEPGKRADFTILSRDPLATPGPFWPGIKVWGVVLSGQKRPLE
ncbi:MAG: amidohydrolase family protein [Pseudomonadota bacterium]